MKKKKVEDPLPPSDLLFCLLLVFLALSFILFGLLLGANLRYLKVPFNPEADICIEECSADESGGSWASCDKPKGNYRKCVCHSNNNKEYYQEIGSFAHCIAWRPKTFCELCIDDWTAECDDECQCDKWGTDEDRKKSQWLLCQKMRYEGRNVDCEHLLTPIKCTSAHEMNECERDNPDYIIAQFCRTSSTSEDGSERCHQESTICRKKTIYDHSCQELKERIWMEDYYCPTINTWASDLITITLCRKKISSQDLKKVYIKKGCEI